jgi:hypothetical protein
MPVTLAPADYACLLGDEPDPRDLMRPFAAGLAADVADLDAGQSPRTMIPQLWNRSSWLRTLTAHDIAEIERGGASMR